MRATIAMVAVLASAATVEAQPADGEPVEEPPAAEPLEEPPPPAPAVDDDEPVAVAPPGRARTPRAGGNQQIYAGLPFLPRPVVEPDTLAFGSELEVVAGSFELVGTGVANNETDDELMLWNLALGTRYFRSLEKTTFGYSVLATGADSLARTPFTGGSMLSNSLVVDASPEARYYPTAGSELFVHGTGVFEVAINSVTFFNTDVDLEGDSNAPGQIGLVGGVGFGRVLAIDPIVRLRRLEMALAEEGTITQPIPEKAGSDIILDWYVLRNDIGNYRQLAYAMKNLNDAGVLNAEPDLRATFKALQVLDDPFIFGRRRGAEARIGLGVVQPFVGYDDLDEPDAELAAVASAQYERPVSTTRQLSVIGKAIAELGGTGATDPARPWSLRGTASLTDVFYTPDYVPTGSLRVTGELGLSGVRQNDAFPPVETGVEAIGSAAYSRLLNRGSLATAAVSVDARNDGVFSISISLGITWGIASGYFTPYTGAAALN